MEVTVSDVGLEANLLTVLVRDIGERKALEAQLAHQATHDALTGLGNRTLLMERLHLALVRLPRHPGAVALLFLDLDRFKTINDTLGHDAGDELIVQAAGLLTGAVRPEDMVARIGGDEFVVLCTDLDGLAAAESIAERVSTALNVSLDLRGHEVFLSASIGLVVTETDQRPAAELMRDADAAMYQAKQRGRGRYALLDEEAREVMNDRLVLSNQLRHAVDREELFACYQPLVDLRSGRIVAVEALMRWQHPERGLLPPAAFLSIAADIGTMVDFDAWMLRHACGATAEWGRRLGQPLGLWVNLSGQSLADPGICNTIATVLEASALDPELLTLEITEGALMRDAATTVGTLSGLKTLGLTLAIDDFGTGYSSLAYLQQFPVHTLKIDRSFVAQLDGEPHEAQASAAIARTIVSLAGSLELQIVAEGIETFGQLTAVADIGCDLGQGYFLGRPATPDDILRAVPGGVSLLGAFGEI
jgi:diguanylate cyclase (GGDEF)-like protein